MDAFNEAGKYVDKFVQRNNRLFYTREYKKIEKDKILVIREDEVSYNKTRYRFILIGDFYNKEIYFKVKKIL
jgi:hypothetical protein